MWGIEPLKIWMYSCIYLIIYRWLLLLVHLLSGKVEVHTVSASPIFFTCFYVLYEIAIRRFLLIAGDHMLRESIEAISVELRHVEGFRIALCTFRASRTTRENWEKEESKRDVEKGCWNVPRRRWSTHRTCTVDRIFRSSGKHFTSVILFMLFHFCTYIFYWFVLYLTNDLSFWFELAIFYELWWIIAFEYCHNRFALFIWYLRIPQISSSSFWRRTSGHSKTQASSLSKLLLSHWLS